MRPLVKEFVQIVVQTVPFGEPIYEFGSLQVAGQEGFADLRPLFPGREYVGCDMQAGPGVDRILNLHHLDLPDETAGTVLLLDTLEHVEFFWQALDEVQRVLRPGGVLVLSSVMDFPVHDYPGDYWRFTPEGFRSLLQRWDWSWVGWAGPAGLPHAVVALGGKGSPPPLDALLGRYRAWQRRWYFPLGWRHWATWAHLALPPAFFLLYRRLMRRTGL